MKTRGYKKNQKPNVMKERDMLRNLVPKVVTRRRKEKGTREKKKEIQSGIEIEKRHKNIK
jgi:hypothetical protein